MANYQFPFQHLDDDELSIIFINDIFMFNIDFLEEKVFVNNSNEVNRFLIDEDPDLNYINDKLYCCCKYYMEDLFLSTFQKK